VAGCATSADPHEGGFVSGVVGLAGGGYQRRVDEREGVHQGELDAQQRLKAQARALEQERAQVSGDLARAQARLAGQERRIARERSRLRAEGKGPTTQASLPNDQPVTDLRARSQGIQKELDEIDSMVSVVSGTRF
jgi:septal ring factor EnvC (AmiA/AmiB activator)